MALITSETAAGMAKLGHEAAKANKAKIASKLAVIESSSWEEQERVRVREAIAKLWRDFYAATTAVDQLRITQSISKLLELCLPKAGAYRPTEARKPRGSGFTPAPQDIEPGQ